MKWHRKEPPCSRLESHPHWPSVNTRRGPLPFPPLTSFRGPNSSRNASKSTLALFSCKVMASIKDKAFTTVGEVAEHASVLQLGFVARPQPTRTKQDIPMPAATFCPFLYQASPPASLLRRHPHRVCYMRRLVRLRRPNSHSHSISWALSWTAGLLDCLSSA